MAVSVVRSLFEIYLEPSDDNACACGQPSGDSGR